MGSCLTTVGRCSAENAEKAGCGEVGGCATGISGIPKNFFTPGFLSAEISKQLHHLVNMTRNFHNINISSFNFQFSTAEIDAYCCITKCE